jgi:LuxR family maltose regulon positive regulatory protein
LNAKLRVPNVTETLERKRLIDRLRGISGKKLALVMAGAGFGKTVLVAQTIAAMKADVAWCALDELDADADDFIRCLIAAIRQQYPDFAIGLSQKLAMPISSKRNRDPR